MKSHYSQEFCKARSWIPCCYNNLSDYICHSKIFQYADDTVLYYANNDVSSVENSLNDDLKRISIFCYDNELILNLKKKPVMLCGGTSKKLSKCRDMHLFYRDDIV